MERRRKRNGFGIHQREVPSDFPVVFEPMSQGISAECRGITMQCPTFAAPRKLVAIATTLKRSKHQFEIGYLQP